MLRSGAPVAVIGAGPGGLIAARELSRAGFEPTLFEASDALGGQWRTGAPHSGAWPGLHTNTSRELTCFSELPADRELPLHPAFPDILAYLERFAREFELTERIRCAHAVQLLERSGDGWLVDGERFEAVVIASGRFRKPLLPPGAGEFGGKLLHSYDYPGAEALQGRTVAVVGNGVSGLEVATDLAGTASRVVSAVRKPRYVIEKRVDGISSDWQWYTMFGGLERTLLPPGEHGRRLRERVIGTAGHPADHGAPSPDPDISIAGVSLCQDYLRLVADGAIEAHGDLEGIVPGGLRLAGGEVFDAEVLICATGYGLDLPYLSEELRRELIRAGATGMAEPNLHLQTFHPGVPGLGVVGQFLLVGPYFPLLELQARWIAGVFSGQAPAPPTGSPAVRPAIESHNALALTLAEAAGVAPDLTRRPELTEALIFGPMLPSRYRLDGPGSDPEAAATFAERVASAPWHRPDPTRIEDLRRFGLGAEADLVESRSRAGRKGPKGPSA